MADQERDVRKFTNPAFDDLARSLHASYLDRWSRHTLDGTTALAEASDQPGEKETEGTSSAA